MQSTLSTRDSSKIANYNQQSQKYLSFEDQLTLNFIANKLLSVEDLTQTLNKLKKIILMFKFRLESTYKMFRLEKVLEDSLNILYEITANIRYNFLGGKRQLARENQKLMKILQEIHNLISEKGCQLNYIIISCFQHMIIQAEKWSQSLNSLKTSVVSLLLEFQIIADEQMQRIGMKKKREIINIKYNKKERQKRELSAPKRLWLVEKMKKLSKPEQIFQDYGVELRQKQKTPISQSSENQKDVNCKSKRRSYQKQQSTPKKEKKGRGCVSFGKLFNRIFSK